MNRRTAMIVVGLAIAAVLALIVLSDGEAGSQPEAETGLPTIVIGADGKPVGGVAELTYEKDDQVRFKIESAVADEIHVHGYDLTKEVEAGGAIGFDFPATLEGIFEAELEDRGEQILELRVEP